MTKDDKKAATGEPREESREEKKAQEEKEPKAKPKASDKVEKLIKSIEELSVLELSDLVKSLQDRFGVSAAPQVATVAAPSGQAAQAAAGVPSEAPEEGQTTFNVILSNSGSNKIAVIKALREINPQLGLKEAKDIADSAPKEILSGVNKTTADEAKQKIEAAGGQVELK